MKIKGRVKIYTKKKNGYVWKQAIINVRSEYIRDLEKLDGKELVFSIGEEEAREQLKEVLEIVDKLFYNLLMAIPERKRRLILEENKELIDRLMKIREVIEE